MPTEPIGVPAAPMNKSARTAVMLGTLSLILTPIVGIAAVAIGRRARKEIAQTGEGGSGLATAGIWMGGAFSVLWVLAVAFLIAMKVGSIAA